MLEQYINSRKIIRRENKIFCCQNCCFRRCYLCARSRLSIDSSYKEGTQRSRHSNTKHILPYFSRFIYIYIYRFLEFLSHRSNFTSCSHYISLLYNYYIVKFVKITVLKSIAQTFFGTITKKKRTITSNTQRAYKYFGGSFLETIARDRKRTARKASGGRRE